VISASRYYLYFDGNSFVSFPTCELEIGDVISMWILPESGTTEYTDLHKIIDAHISEVSISTRRIDVNFDRFSRLIGGTGATAKVDGINQAVPDDGKPHYVELTVDKSGRSVGTIGARGSQDSYFYRGYMFDVRIKNERFYSLGESFLSPLILRDSIGGYDGQGYNFQPSSISRVFNA
jgi:hypothetical protein